MVAFENVLMISSSPEGIWFMIIHKRNSPC